MRDIQKLKETIKRAKKDGDERMINWCENWLKYLEKGGTTDVENG